MMYLLNLCICYLCCPFVFYFWGIACRHKANQKCRLRPSSVWMVFIAYFLFTGRRRFPTSIFSDTALDELDRDKQHRDVMQIGKRFYMIPHVWSAAPLKSQRTSQSRRPPTTQEHQRCGVEPVKVLTTARSASEKVTSDRPPLRRHPFAWRPLVRQATAEGLRLRCFFTRGTSTARKKSRLKDHMMRVMAIWLKLLFTFRWKNYVA